jgi:hypothetical protein
MNFGDALSAVKNGSRISRSTWNAPGQYVMLQMPDKYSKMQRPYLYLSPVDGNLVPWVPTISDVLADDWIDLSD